MHLNSEVFLLLLAMAAAKEKKAIFNSEGQSIETPRLSSQVKSVS